MAVGDALLLLVAKMELFSVEFRTRARCTLIASTVGKNWRVATGPSRVVRLPPRLVWLGPGGGFGLARLGFRQSYPGRDQAGAGSFIRFDGHAAQG